MAPPPPTGHATIELEAFGSVKGLEFENGVRQFCGIPYASLQKRWTRATLLTTLSSGYHDGTKHGPICPQPPEFDDLENFMVPVPPIPHFPDPPVQDEFHCLNLTVVLPPKHLAGRPHPIMCWIHGGSFLVGASSEPAYDMVNLVSQSVERGTPVIGVSINYRVGLFGFLASEPIRAGLQQTESSVGCGNFGLTDQQIALAWIQRFLPQMHGDVGNVTLFGESAGGMAVAHQIWAAHPAVFHRAICMSGTLNTIPVWTMQQHELRWKALLRHLRIDPAATNHLQLDQLRALPQEHIAAATLPIDGGITTGNPCDDGWFHAYPPRVMDIRPPPAWLQALMLGDVTHEAVIFHTKLLDMTYDSLFKYMAQSALGKEATQIILGKFNIHSELSVDELILRYEDMATEAIFKLPNWLHARSCSKSNHTETEILTYHFDQMSTLDNPLKGTAYHAIDNLYVFMNMEEQMSPAQVQLARKMAGHFIDFAYGGHPWEPFDSAAGQTMVYGSHDECVLKTRGEDDAMRQYNRMQDILDMGEETVEAWVRVVDEFSNKRWLLRGNAE